MSTTEMERKREVRINQGVKIADTYKEDAKGVSHTFNGQFAILEIVIVQV